MKNIIICSFIFTSIISYITKADTVFVKNGGILAPIEVNPSNNNSSVGAESLIGSISLSNRTDTTVALSGSLTESAVSVNTWFVLEIDPVSGFQSQDSCSNLTRRNEQVLNNASETNVFTATNLLPGTRYTVTFCGQPSNSNSRIATSTAFDSFTTKRNESTLVIHDCNSNEIFRSTDGPLNIRVIEDFDTAIFRSSRDSSAFTISNFDTDVLRYDITISGFSAQLLGDSLRIPASTQRVDTAFPNRTTEDDGREVFQYGVRIFGAQNWTAEFSCRELQCVSGVRRNERICEQNFPIR